jgi:hypothetical protein
MRISKDTIKMLTRRGGNPAQLELVLELSEKLNKLEDGLGSQLEDLLLDLIYNDDSNQNKYNVASLIEHKHAVSNYEEERSYNSGDDYDALHYANYGN